MKNGVLESMPHGWCLGDWCKPKNKEDKRKCHKWIRRQGKEIIKKQIREDFDKK